MTQLDVYGLTGETRPAVFDPAAERVRVLVAAWLLSKKNENTRKAYRRDVMAWIGWCEENEIDPLNVRRAGLSAADATDLQTHLEAASAGLLAARQLVWTAAENA